MRVASQLFRIYAKNGRSGHVVPHREFYSKKVQFEKFRENTQIHELQTTDFKPLR